MFMICPVISNKNLGGVHEVETYLHKTSQEKISYLCNSMFQENVSYSKTCNSMFFHSDIINVIFPCKP